MVSWYHVLILVTGADLQTRLMPALDGWKEAAFVGYFGPIGEPLPRLASFG